MLLNKSFSANKKSKSSSKIGPIVQDVVPRSIADGSDKKCSYTCSCCPTISNWCVKDAFGIICCFVTWSLFLYGQFVVVIIIYMSKTYTLLNFINLFSMHFLAFLALSSYCRTMFSNPGAIPLNNATSEKLHKVCQRCIKRMDHHCIFVNNCVGQNNQKYFILFTFYTCVVAIYALIFLYFHLTTCITSNWTACPAWSPPVTLFFTIILALEAFCFSIFTAIMTGIQFVCIYTDTTGVEFFRGRSKSNLKRNSFLASLKIVFGAQIGLTWLNPYSKPTGFLTQNDEHISFDT
ncbi:unnamed protein product [Adineta steineri]|uniref:Palmitoyltransferase n=1 Tax=Adineta steineri TaxID=433720 RepID=A0A815C047_9BILA|nr:unnamed protein product [Adineta steineri]